MIPSALRNSPVKRRTNSEKSVVRDAEGAKTHSDTLFVRRGLSYLLNNADQINDAAHVDVVLPGTRTLYRRFRNHNLQIDEVGHQPRVTRHLETKHKYFLLPSLKSETQADANASSGRKCETDAVFHPLMEGSVAFFVPVN